MDQGGRSGAVLGPGTVQSHVILALGGLRLRDGGIVLSFGLVIFLCGNHFLVVELFHAFEGLFHHVLLHQCLLP